MNTFSSVMVVFYQACSVFGFVMFLSGAIRAIFGKGAKWNSKEELYFMVIGIGFMVMGIDPSVFK